jgi:hypothetical protein
VHYIDTHYWSVIRDGHSVVVVVVVVKGRFAVVACSEEPHLSIYYIYKNECLYVCLSRMRSYTIHPIAMKLR